FAVSRPEAIFKVVDGVRHEPFEQLTVDFDASCQGAVMELLGARGAELLDMVPDGKGRVRLDYRIPARGLIGLRTQYLTATAGTGVLYHVFDGYDRERGAIDNQRTNGVLIANGEGVTLPYALFHLQERGQLFV